MSIFAISFLVLGFISFWVGVFDYFKRNNANSFSSGVILAVILLGIGKCTQDEFITDNRKYEIQNKDEKMKLKEKLDESGNPIHGLIDLGALSGLAVYWVVARVRTNGNRHRIEFDKIDKENLTIDTRNITNGRAYVATVFCGTSRGQYKAYDIAFPAAENDNSHIFELFEERAAYHREKSAVHAEMETKAEKENRPEAEEQHRQASVIHEEASESYAKAIEDRDDRAGDGLNSKTELAKRESQEAYDADLLPPEKEKEIPLLFPVMDMRRNPQFSRERLLEMAQNNEYKVHRDEIWNAFRRILPPSFFKARAGHDKIKPRAWDMYYYTTTWPILKTMLTLKHLEWAGKTQVADRWDCNRIASSIYAFFTEDYNLTPAGFFADDHKKYGSGHAYNIIFGIDENGQLGVKVWDGTEERFIPEHELHSGKWNMSGGNFYH